MDQGLTLLCWQPGIPVLAGLEPSEVACLRVSALLVLSFT